MQENKRITSLKRYLRLAGIHTSHYFKVLQNCRSNKAKIEALLDLLRKEGLRGVYIIEVTRKVVSVLMWLTCIWKVLYIYFVYTLNSSSSSLYGIDTNACCGIKISAVKFAILTDVVRDFPLSKMIE